LPKLKSKKPLKRGGKESWQIAVIAGIGKANLTTEARRHGENREKIRSLFLIRVNPRSSAVSFCFSDSGDSARFRR